MKHSTSAAPTEAPIAAGLEIRRLVSTEEAARLLNRKAQTLRKYRVTGEGPPYIPGKRVLYDTADLVEWANAKKRRSTSDPGPELCSSLIPTGIEYNKTLEDTRTGIAAVLLANQDRPIGDL